MIEPRYNPSHGETAKAKGAPCESALAGIWENRASRSPALLQLERCGIKVEVDPQRIQEVLDRDPPHGGDPTRG